MFCVCGKYNRSPTKMPPSESPEPIHMLGDRRRGTKVEGGIKIANQMALRWGD